MTDAFISEAEGSVQWIDDEDIIPEESKEQSGDWSHYVNLETGGIYELL